MFFDQKKYSNCVYYSAEDDFCGGGIHLCLLQLYFSLLEYNRSSYYMETVHSNVISSSHTFAIISNIELHVRMFEKIIICIH